MPSTQYPDFYWQTARDNILTDAALTMFQIALQHIGQDFDEIKDVIDDEYNSARGRGESQRHGGNFQTHIRVFEEAGWMYLEDEGERKVIRITPAGEQAAVLLLNTPDFLKAVPYFVVELLSRYQLNNPAGPNETRNQEMSEATSQSTIFPYWTIYKIMRSCENYITSEELQRFVFRLHRTEDIDRTINQILAFRRDKEAGATETQLNQNYPTPLTGAVREPKYIMGRAGIHIGKYPPVITKSGTSTYQLNPSYFRLIDEIINNEPIFREYLDNESWMRDYGQPVLIPEEFIPFAVPESENPVPLHYADLPDEDQIWRGVRNLVDAGRRNILFVGPPGTSKTWYALHIGAKLAEHQQHRFRNVQFHQSFGYEDFMEGYIPSDSRDSSATFVLKLKTFLLACNTAYRHPDELHVFVIDELNRGDPSRIFGEALTYVERRDEPFILSSGTKVIIPSNLVILATMNPYDKSISDLDMAMERRFVKVEMPPDKELLRKILIEKNSLSPALAGQIVGFFDFLSSVVEDRIGHAYFDRVGNVEQLRLVWEHSILPLLKKELRFQSADKLAAVEERFGQMITNIEGQTS